MEEHLKKIAEIRPLFTKVITTADKYESNEEIPGTTLIDIKKKRGTLKEYQTVVAVGTAVRPEEVKVGDVVCINPARYAVKQHQAGTLKDGIVTDNPVISYNFNIVEMASGQCLMLELADIDFVVVKFEE